MLLEIQQVNKIRKCYCNTIPNEIVSTSKNTSANVIYKYYHMGDDKFNCKYYSKFCL